jgi:LysM repeat protein
MKNVWQVVRGILIALVSVGLLFGGLSLSLAEGNMKSPPADAVATSTLTSTVSPTVPLVPTLTPTLKTFATEADTATPLPPSSTPTLPPPPTNCPPPPGWVAYFIKSGDTLSLLSTRYRVSVANLQEANCLSTSELIPGAIIYVPPSPTQTRIPCGPPSGWILSLVQPGDTLFRLSQSFGVTVTQLQNANCMGSSTLLRVGRTFYLPSWATRTPSPTIPPVDTPVLLPTDTIGGFTPTATEYSFFWTETATEIQPPTAIPTDTQGP